MPAAPLLILRSPQLYTRNGKEGNGGRGRGRTAKREIRAKSCGAQMPEEDEDEMDEMNDTHNDVMDVYHHLYNQHHYQNQHHNHQHQHHHHHHHHHHHPVRQKSDPIVSYLVQTLNALIEIYRLRGSWMETTSERKKPPWKYFFRQSVKEDNAYKFHNARQ